MRKRRFHGQTIRLPEEEKLKFDLFAVRHAKHEKRCLDDKVILIKCLGGKIHKIQMRFPGRITLLSHPDMGGERTMMKLGGDKPECLTFLEQWKSTNPAQAAYNRTGVQRFLQSRQDWKAMRYGEQSLYSDWLSWPIAQRLYARILDLRRQLTTKLDRLKLKGQGVRYSSWSGPQEVPDFPLLTHSIKFEYRFSTKINP